MKWKTRIMRSINRLVFDMDTLQARDRERIDVAVAFDDGVVISTEGAVALPVYQERYSTFTKGDKTPHAVKTSVDGLGLFGTKHPTAGRIGSEVKRDLDKYLLADGGDNRTVRWYRRGTQPDCDFIDCSMEVDREVTLGNVNKEPKQPKVKMDPQFGMLNAGTSCTYTPKRRGRPAKNKVGRPRKIK